MSPKRSSSPTAPRFPPYGSCAGMSKLIDDRCLGGSVREVVDRSTVLNHRSWSRHGRRPPQAMRRIDMANQTGNSAPVILVPGFWLGAWAWDEVASILRTDGHEVTALTLPGLESADADRSAITLSDHIDVILDAVRSADAPVVLAVHSASGFS